jgi:hypothetical protein
MSTVYVGSTTPPRLRKSSSSPTVEYGTHEKLKKFAALAAQRTGIDKPLELLNYAKSKKKLLQSHMR